jgi:hypothetical protein
VTAAWRDGLKVPPTGPLLPLRPLHKVENAFARPGMWRRLSRRHEQTALGAQTWLEVACVACLSGRLRVEPT